MARPILPYEEVSLVCSYQCLRETCRLCCRVGVEVKYSFETQYPRSNLDGVITHTDTVRLVTAVKSLIPYVNCSPYFFYLKFSCRKRKSNVVLTHDMKAYGGVEV